MSQRTVGESGVGCRRRAQHVARRGWTRWQIPQGQVEVLFKGSGKLVRDFNQESEVMKSNFKTASSATNWEGYGGQALCGGTNQRPCHPQGQ